jgi:mono/diheme cytochrome c family protein
MTDLPTRPPQGLTLAVLVASLLAGGRHLPAAEKAASRTTGTDAAPVVAGFARFPAADPVQAGRLLLGELNCTSCHRPDAVQEASLLRKAAPVLDGVGGRLRRSYFRKFLSSPQEVKPGTTMPHVFAGVPEAEKQQDIDALVHFLASTGSAKPERPARKLIPAGREVYHRAGCVACHGSRDAAGNPDKTLPTSVPLGDLKAKYALGGLRKFLENPHQVRPSGRMPGLLNPQEAQQVANYLLQGVSYEAAPPNMNYAYYEGNWSRLPDFNTLKPLATGKTADFDLSVAHRPNDFALRFEGYLRIDHDGDYRFHLTSDDGGQLYLDGKLVVNNDGVHPPTTVTGTGRLTRGMHKLVAAVFNAGGGVELHIDIEGNGLGRQDVSPLVFLTPAGPPPVPPAEAKDDEHLAVRPELAEKGRKLLAALGCANCHQFTIGGKAIEPVLAAPPLARLRPAGGCLAATATKGVPWYELDRAQRSALAAVLKARPPKDRPGPKEVIARTLTTFNCYACHERDKVGGVPEELNAFFTTTQPEMGDEGRVPPPLDGVGAKLTAAYLRHVLDQGAHDRPYMHTRMPRFGDANVGQLVAAFEAVDPQPAVPKVTFREPLHRVKATARKLVGDGALSCIKCHMFAGHKAEGIQALDLTLMPQRLKRDWFQRYMLNPQAIRPGTRMPAAWPDGITFYKKIFDGDTVQQIEAVWVYLGDGGRALLPPGLKKNSIPLVPEKEAILYRNFIEGAGPRAIGVGYPEKAHLAFDANDLRLALLWQGAFLDAARHWTDRGAGFEPPLGDNILHLPEGVSFAFLGKDDAPWPATKAPDLGYHFRGYRLTPDDRPTFLYSCGDVQVEDFPNAVAGKENPSIRRTLSLKSSRPVDNFYFRAAVADKIEPAGDGWYKIDGEWKLRIEAAGSPQVRKHGSKVQLLVPVRFQEGRARIVEEFVW